MTSRSPLRHSLGAHIEGMLREPVEHAAHRATINLVPMGSAPSPPTTSPIIQDRRTVRQTVLRHKLASNLHRLRRRWQDGMWPSATSLPPSLIPLLLFRFDSDGARSPIVLACSVVPPAHAF